MSSSASTQHPAQISKLLDAVQQSASLRRRRNNLLVIARATDDEVRQSRLLAWLIDPRSGTHARELLTLLLGACEPPSKILIPTDYVVATEVAGSRSIIDVAAYASQRFVVFLENKVWTEERVHQTSDEYDDLQAYATWLGVPDRDSRVAVFLSPTGNRPTQAGSSLNSWRTLSYADLARTWGAWLAEQRDGSPSPRTKLLLEDWIESIPLAEGAMDTVLTDDMRLLLSNWEAAKYIRDLGDDLKRWFAQKLRQGLQARLQSAPWWNGEHWQLSMTTPSEWKVTNRLWNQAVEIGVLQFEPDDVLYPGSGAIMWIWCPTAFSHIVSELRERLRERLAAESSTVAGAGRGQGNYIVTRSTGAIAGASLEADFDTALDRVLDQVVERFGLWQEALNICSDLFVQPATS